MIKETEGNLLEADAEALVNAVNCVGVMGKGLALQFRKTFSEAYFKDYKRACQNGDLQIGKVHIYSLNSKSDHRFIVNFPTKNHWREKSKIEYIESGMESLVKKIEEHHIKSIAIPALGCGLGGLDWKDVEPLIERAVSQVPEIQILLYRPKD